MNVVSAEKDTLHLPLTALELLVHLESDQNINLTLLMLPPNWSRAGLPTGSHRVLTGPSRFSVVFVTQTSWCLVVRL